VEKWGFGKEIILGCEHEKTWDAPQKDWVFDYFKRRSLTRGGRKLRPP